MIFPKSIIFPTSCRQDFPEVRHVPPRLFSIISFIAKNIQTQPNCTDDLKAAYIHFLKVGRNENRQPSYYFDTSYYLDKTPVLYDTGLDPLGHYFAFGYRERKSPSPLFDAVFYVKAYGLATDIDPYDHFLRSLSVEERQPCSWFDPNFYRQTYLTGKEGIPAFKHYLQSGRKDGLYPNRKCSLLADKPVISIVVPVYNVEIAHLNNCIRSVFYQSYPHWQLCLADDCSTDQRIRLVLSEWASSDTRIKVVFLAENVGIAAATNAAAQLAEGRYLAFLDNDDELAPEALQTIAQAINNTPAGLYYSDEDLIGADGRQFSIFRKPGYNRELLLCHNYVTHLVVTERLLFEKVGGCAEEFNGAQDLDLFLKLSEQAETVLHIPEVLYHWRASETSTSINHGKKQYADEAGRQSIANALAPRRSMPRSLASFRIFSAVSMLRLPGSTTTMTMSTAVAVPRPRCSMPASMSMTTTSSR